MNCSDLPKPIVYVSGSSAAKPVLANLGAALATAATPLTVVYQGNGSCTGVAGIYGATPITGTATYWNTPGTGGMPPAAQSCSLSLTGDAIDIGISDVFSKSCPNTPDDATIGDFWGPVQVMNLVVPAASSQTTISAEAAYLLFGFGAAGAVAPFTDDNLIFIRSETSGTQQMIAAAINVPANKWKGVQNAKSSDVQAKVEMSAMPEATIGILASDLADPDVTAGKLKILQYQHYGQGCGFLPDSKSSAHDKLNVRDGHYPIWGPLHFFAKVGADKKPASAAAAQLIGYITGTQEAPAGVNLVDIEIAAHTVPLCAMQVARTSEVGPLMSSAPAKPCGCYFENKANGATSCTNCMTDGDCKSGTNTHCRYGYCEAS